MPEVEITLTHDESLVLFDLLTRYSETDVLGTRDQSEQRALWNLQCLLEKTLPEALDHDYAAMLTTAQE